MQTGVTAANGKITGTLHYISSGQIVTDWGAGNFLALKFDNIDERATSCKVGLEPSQGSGLVELDEDKMAMFKITDHTTQKVKIVTSDGKFTEYQTFDLSELVCEEE